MITVKTSFFGTLFAQVIVPEIGMAYNDGTDEDHVYATLAELCREAAADVKFYALPKLVEARELKMGN